MDCIQRFTHRLLPSTFSGNCFKAVPGVSIRVHTFTRFSQTRNSIFKSDNNPRPALSLELRTRRSHSSSSTARAGWFLGLGEKKQDMPDIVKAGDPVLHEPAREVSPEEIGSDRIQKIIDDMVKVMRKAPGVGLAAPQIGIPLKVILNPQLRKKSNKSALFFEGCLSVDGFRAVVERHLEVEVTGLDRYGQPIKVDASGWQARILQHECDHLDGTLYVDKMVPRTFRTVENLDLPLATGCSKLGVR